MEPDYNILSNTFHTFHCIGFHLVPIDEPTTWLSTQHKTTVRSCQIELFSVSKIYETILPGKVQAIERRISGI